MSSTALWGRRDKGVIWGFSEFSGGFDEIIFCVTNEDTYAIYKLMTGVFCGEEIGDVCEVASGEILGDS